MLVVLDTNVLFRDPLLSSADALAIRDAAEQLGYRLGLAGVVHEEAVHKESQKIEKAASDATKAIRQLEGHGLNLNPSLPAAKEMSGAAADYAAHLRQVFAPKDHLP